MALTATDLSLICVHEDTCFECGAFTQTTACSYHLPMNNKAWDYEQLCAFCLPQHYAMHELAGDEPDHHYIEVDLRWAEFELDKQASLLRLTLPGEKAKHEPNKTKRVRGRSDSAMRRRS